jgi:ABC-2 type transport system ATP-binding protein
MSRCRRSGDFKFEISNFKLGGPVPAIEALQIKKCFGAFCAVDSLSFAVQEGEIFGLLGPNGAGKSTLIRMLTTLLPPTSGSARINGFDVVRSADKVRRSIGVIPQAMTSDLDLSAKENMNIFAKLYGVPRERRRQVVKGLLEAVDLGSWADKQVKNFSGGMRRRLEIARGLVHEPNIFFLDEPTTGLDPASRIGVWEMLRKLKEGRDLTILLTTHYMDEADKLCDRIAIMDHGKLVALDSPLKLKASIPGNDILEISFARVPAGWSETLKNLSDVQSVKAEDHVYRIGSNNGPRTTVALMEATHLANVEITSLSVQSTTLDDVFMHYTGRQLRDTLQEPAYDSGFMPPRR